MLAIRLFRIGKKNQPFFKVVVTEKQNAARRGRFVEDVGSYDPLKKNVHLAKDRIAYWLGVGAKASPTVHNLLVNNEVIQGDKVKIKVAQPAAKEEEKKEEAQPAAKQEAEQEAPAKEEAPKAEEEKPEEKAEPEEKQEEASSEQPEQEQASEK